MKDLKIINNNGQLLADSREVAEMTERRHADLLRDIEGYKTILDQNAKLRSDDFFKESAYIAGTGKAYKHFYLTRKGCDMVANKMTGEKGILFTATYVTRFEAMEEKLKEPRLLSEREQLIASMKLSIETSEDVQVIKGEVKELKNKVENEITINLYQQQALQHAINKRVCKLHDNSNKEYTKSKLFAQIHSHLRRAFAIPSYRVVRKKDFEEAMLWVKGWRPI